MSHRHLKEELTCPICMELFRRPRRLPCGHSYCHICLKAMLERCSEDSRLYLHYPGSLVCPECREEVNLDYGCGVEAIPPDFKLSKLVDLFKFMKKNDSSDSSSDELHACSAVPCALTSYTPENTAAAVTIAFVSATNSSAVLSQSADWSSSPVSQSLAATSAVSLPTQFQIAATSVGSSHPQIATTSVGSSHPQIATTSVGSSHPQIATTLATASSPTQPQTSTPPTQASTTPFPGISPTASPTDPQIQTSSEQFSSDSPAVIFVDSASTSGPVHPSIVRHHNDLHPALTTSSGDVPYQYNPDTICLTTSGGTSRNPLPSNTAYNPSATETTNDQTQALSKNRLPLELNMPSNVIISLDTNADGGSRIGRNSHEDLNSELGAVGGSIYNGRDRNSHPGMTEQNGDSSEIISDWVNENHFYSQNSHGVSEFSSSLPVKEAQLCHENIPLVPSCDDDRTTRAQSVPAEMGELKRSGEAGRSTECVAAKDPPKVRTRRARSGVFSRFGESDSSSDSSGSDRRTTRRPVGKPKRWLMTRFLRSVILSESSSTDYSDNDDGTLENKAKNSQIVTEKADSQVSHDNSSRLQSATADHTHSPHTSQSLDQIHSPHTCKSQDGSIQKRSRTANHEIELNPDTRPNSSGHNAPLKTKTPDTLSTQPQRRHSSSSSPRQQSGSDMSQTLHSVNSSTLPKELLNQSSPNQSTDSTLPKHIHNSPIDNVVWPISTTSSSNNTSIPQTNNPHLTGKHCGQTARTEIHQQTLNLHSIGSPPTFYDNVNVITNNRERKTVCDNLPSVGSPPTFYDNVIGDHCLQQTRYNNGGFRRGLGFQDSVSLSLRDPNLNPGSSPRFATRRGQQHATHTSRPYEGETFYDNINSSSTRPIQTLRAIHHNSTRMVNPITDIEELKTGYEHVHPEHEGSEHDSSLEVGHKEDRHVGELNDNIGCLPISAQDSRYGNEQRILASSSSNPVSARMNPENIALVDSSGHRSLYDNVNNSIYTDHPRHSNSSNQGNAGGKWNIPEGISPVNTECSSQRQRIRNTEYRTKGHHNVQLMADTSSHRNEDLQYIDNYFDQYSQHFRGGCATDQNSATSRGVIREGDATQRTTGAAAEAATETDLSTDRISSKVPKDVQNLTNPGAFAKTDSAKSQRKTESSGIVTEALTTPETCSGSTTTPDSSATSNSDEGPLNSEGGSISGASMPQNKKPHSRLKKFFTSLLSLSSSDNEEDKNYNGSSSSDSSDW